MPASQRDERRRTISTNRRLTPDEIARHTFGTARRGFDPAEVRTFLDIVSREIAEREREIADYEDRVGELLGALAEAEQRAANPVLDEATLTASVGHETARVLLAARESASEITAKAQAEADRLIGSAREEAETMISQATEEARDRLAAAQEEIEVAKRSAEEEARVTKESALAEAEAARLQAREECRAMVLEAQELRTRVLTDLAKRRRLLHSQIEQLRAGRQALLDTVRSVRRDVDAIAEELFRAEDEARMAAEEAAQRVAAAQESEQDLEPVGAQQLAPVSTELEPAQPEPGEAGTGDSGPEPGQLATGEAGPEGPRPEKRGDRGLEPEEPTAQGSGEAELKGIEAPRSESFGAALGAEATRVEVSGGEGEGLHRRSEVTGEHMTSAVQAQPLPGSSEPARPRVDEVFARLRATGIEIAAVDDPRSQSSTRKGEELEASDVQSPEVGQAGTAESFDDLEGPQQERDVDPRLVQRDEMLDPVATNLARRLKRALQDDQNDVLDRIRSGKGWSEKVLEPEVQHVARYAEAVVEVLAEAQIAGARFAGGSADDANRAQQLATDLAGAIVGPLRRRLVEAAGSVDPGDEAALLDKVGSAYRDWKGPRVESLAGDHVVVAFSSAVVDTLAKDRGAKGRRVEWVVDDDGVECPDCDDNALAGAIPVGEPFPTGHLHPPAHPGCRCLVAPAGA